MGGPYQPASDESMATPQPRIRVYRCRPRVYRTTFAGHMQYWHVHGVDAPEFRNLFNLGGRLKMAKHRTIL